MIKVTTIIEDVEEYPKHATSTPTTLKFVHELRGTGDNPRFFADTVQRAVAKAARGIHEYMEKTVDLRDEPIKVKPYMPERA